MVETRLVYHVKIVVLGIILGAVYVVTTLPIFDLIQSDSSFWYHGDPGSHVSAAQMYLNEPFDWPLLQMRSLGYPIGVNSAFADIIPLIALPAKLVSNIFQFEINARFLFLGWIVFCYLALAVAALYLLTQFRDVSWPAATLGSLVFLTAPMILFRVHAHLALVGQFWVLAALALYFRRVDMGQPASRYLLGQCAAIVGSLLTHPYLFAMVVPILLASECDRWRACQDSRAFLQRTATIVAVIIVSLVFFGYLGGHGIQAGSFGFGYHSMNLAAPFVGSDFFSMPGLQAPHPWYPTIPFPVDMTGGQYEGYAYVGAGILLMLPILAWTAKVTCIRRYLALVLCVSGFLGLALTHRVYLGQYLIVDVPMNHYLMAALDIFRASGRFVWPLIFLIYLMCILAVIQVARGWRAPAILLLVFTVQLLDLKPLRVTTQAVLSPNNQPSLLSDDPWWEDRLSENPTLIVLPTTGCGARPFEDVLPLQIAAAEFGLRFNSGTLARGYGPCAEKMTEAKQLINEGDALVVFLNESSAQAVLSQSLTGAVNRSNCTERKQGLVCVF